jgi:hypothetical protein
LPGSGSQQCGYFDVNRNIAPNNLIFNSSKVGGIDDIYDGYDFEVQARLGTTFISGGMSWGRERINTCNLKDDLSLSAPSVLPLAATTLETTRSATRTPTGIRRSKDSWRTGCRGT